jgi:hypothetical protein
MNFLFLWLSWFSRSVGFCDFQMSSISEFSDLSGSCVSWFAWCVGFCRFHVFMLFGFRGIWLLRFSILLISFCVSQIFCSTHFRFPGFTVSWFLWVWWLYRFSCLRSFPHSPDFHIFMIRVVSVFPSFPDPWVPEIFNIFVYSRVYRFSYFLHFHNF